MRDKKVLISCGPIPAKLDSVKFITNRFKGGLAFKTASKLYNMGYNVTVVKWKHTKLPNGFTGNSIIDVEDVVDYYNGIKNNAKSYDVFIMAAAVANLMPSNPYEGKFPSHNYKVGEKFDIKFEIAPRAIDIVKKENPRCCLIGYKLFDAKTDDELIDIARHTLHDSKANIIFANTPSTAKTEKIALMQDNSAIKMSFDEHIDFIVKLIESNYFCTIEDDTILNGYRTIDTKSKISMEYFAARGIVSIYDKQFKESGGFGTIAIKTSLGMVTTSRGHNGEGINERVLVKDVNFKTRTIIASSKATLNAPTLWKMLEDEPVGTYVIHRHVNDPLANPDFMTWEAVDYQFPGTLEEVNAISGKKHVFIKNHGYLDVRHFEKVNWDQYYEQFPSKYFTNIHPEMARLIDKYCHDEYETLEIGGNKTCVCKYNLDVNMPSDSKNINYKKLKQLEGVFDFILLRNCINYLSDYELSLAVKALKPGGILIANGFKQAPGLKVTDNEVAALENSIIRHYLIVGDQIFHHNFHARGMNEYKEAGFTVEETKNSRSIIIKYIKE